MERERPQWQQISKFVDNGKLQIDTDGEFDTVQKIYDEYPGLSIPDSSVLELALRKVAVIYSSDGSLRKISVKRGLTVRGILWIIEELYSNGFLTKEQAMRKLTFYETINQRAPANEIKKLIRKLIENNK